MAKINFFIGEDLTVAIAGLRDGYDDSYLNSATITAQLKDAAGDDVGAAATLSYQATTDGNYKGVIDAAITALMTENRTYHIDITIASGAYDGLRRLTGTAVYHGAKP